MSQFSLLGWTFSAAGLFCSYNDGDVTTKRKQKQLVGGRAMWRTCFWLSWRIQMHMSLCAAQLLFFFSASSSSSFLLFRPSPGLHAVLTLNRFGSLSLSLVDHEIGNSHLAIFHGGNVFHRREQLIVGAWMRSHTRLKKKKEIRKANSLIEMLVSMYGVSVYHICVCWVQIRNAALSLFIPTQGSIMRAIYMRPCGQQHTLTHTTRDCVLWCESEGEKESRKNRRKKKKQGTGSNFQQSTSHLLHVQFDEEEDEWKEELGALGGCCCC